MARSTFATTGTPGSHRLSEGGLFVPSAGTLVWESDPEYFNVTGGSRLNTPDTADLDDITEDIEIWFEISNWADTGATQVVYGRWGGSGGNSWFAGVADGGGLIFFTRDSLGNYREVTSAEALTESHIQCRIRYDKSASTVTMFTKPAGALGWTALTGGTMNLLGETIRTGSDQVSAGAQEAGGEPFAGRIHQARVWGTGFAEAGTEIAAWKASDYVSGTTFTSGTDVPRVWTLNGSPTHGP